MSRRQARARHCYACTTAGADGRQYRALMNHKRITSDHRVIAFDRRIAFATGRQKSPGKNQLGQFFRL
jgi:hypothetical protein